MSHTILGSVFFGTNQVRKKRYERPILGVQKVLCAVSPASFISYLSCNSYNSPISSSLFDFFNILENILWVNVLQIYKTLKHPQSEQKSFIHFKNREPEIISHINGMFVNALYLIAQFIYFTVKTQVGS